MVPFHGLSSGEKANRTRWCGAVGILAILCILLEAAQLFNPVRHTRISDLGVNFFGVVFGLTMISGQSNFSHRLKMIWWRHWQLVMRCTTCMLISGGLYIVARTHQGISLSNWDADMPLMVGNEATLDRPWKGTIRSVLLYDDALGRDNIQTLNRNDHTFRVIGRELNESHTIDVATVGIDGCTMLADRSS